MSYPTHGFKQAPKRKRRALWIATLIAAALAVVCTCGVLVASFAGDPKTTSRPPASGAPTAQQAGEQPAAEPVKPNTFNQPIGTTIITETGGGTTEVTVTAAKWQKAGCKSSAMKPQTGKYVVVDVTVKITAGKGSINSLYFTYIDASNTQAETLGGMFAGCKNLDSGNDFPTGTVRSGQLAYDVAAGPGTLTWSGSLGEQIGSWTIPA